MVFTVCKCSRQDRLRGIWRKGSNRFPWHFYWLGYLYYSMNTWSRRCLERNWSLWCSQAGRWLWEGILPRLRRLSPCSILFNKETETQVVQLKGHTKKVNRVVYHMKEDVTIPGSNDNTVSLWNIKLVTAGTCWGCTMVQWLASTPASWSAMSQQPIPLTCT